MVQKYVVDEGKEWSVRPIATDTETANNMRLIKRHRQIEYAFNLPKLQQMKYQEPQRWDLLKGYKSEVTSGNISPLVGFKNFEKEHNSLIERFVGTKTSDGIEIRGSSLTLRQGR